MEALANLFVTLVTVANTVLPQANIPQVLGVKIAEDEVLDDRVSTEPVPLTLRLEQQNEMKKRLREAQEEARKKREEIVNEFRERRQEALAELEKKREEFQLKLQEIKDERKQKIVENIDERLSSLNEKWVSHWNRVLSRLTEILAKITSRADALAAEGVDVSSVRSAVTVAEAAISAAQEAVNNQVGNTYVVDITSEENLGQDVKSVISDFHANIKSVWDKVKSARLAVGDALKVLKEVASNDE